jgi:hypothetical protein
MARSIRKFPSTLLKKLKGDDSEIFSRFPFLREDDTKWLASISARILNRTGHTVYSGPFSGMKLEPGSFLTRRPMWATGCYEQEIEQALLEIIAKPPRRVIDLGSAYGYYSVGFATQIADAQIVAFEADESIWLDAAKLADANGVRDRIEQRGLCTVSDLAAVGIPDSAVLCDCEGAEIELLVPDQLEFLKSSRIICEIHEFYREGATRTLISRFQQTHDIRVIIEQARNPAQFRVLDGLSPTEKWLAVRETKHIPGRVTAGKFLWMKPHKSIRQ